MSINLVILSGRLGRDPETKETKSGSIVCNLSLATSERVGTEERTEWHRVVAFGKTAEFAAKYLAKGREISVIGRLQTRTWEQDGSKRYMTEIVANRLEAHGPKSDAPARDQPADDWLPPDNAADVPF